ncbi:MAG TPA: hypothetical protein VJ824_16105 [Bacillota bacterium]|nr:hypothetical protein [Bacillota bacterium]
MSFPTIPTMTLGHLNRCDVLNLLLASIAMEELGLAHLINAEAEKIQFVITSEDYGRKDLLEINESARKMLRDVIKKEMLLLFKLNDVLEQTIIDGFDDCDK